MKTCPKKLLLSSTELIIVFFHLLTTIDVLMLNIMIWESLFLDVGSARCIHDRLQFAIKDQSPQVYEGLLNSPAIQQSSKESMTFHNHQNVLHTNEEYGINSGLASKLKIDGTITSRYSKSTSSGSRTKRENVSANLQLHQFNSTSDSLIATSNSHGSLQEFSDIVNALNLINVTYQPLRLKVWYDFNFMSFANTSIEYERLKQGLDRSVEVIKKLLSVIPVKGNLLLKRVKACGSYWQDDSSTANSQKCGHISTKYDGEKCLDDFKVPDSHLSGFAVYHKNGSSPSKVHFLDGKGISDADTVIYVRSYNTKMCTTPNVIAYASSCQLDQFYRPIAGYANFCPNQLSSDQFDANKFYLTVLHELFHLLGFSKKLFKNFQACKIVPTPSSESYVGASFHINENLTLVCERRKTVVDFLDGWHRVVTPQVMEKAHEHFNCAAIGGPLEGVKDNPMESSHWESRILQPSIMTSSIGLPHLTMLDPITLALFSDTGWYKVNMSLSSPLVWGRGAGCQFGTLSNCRSSNSSFFCIDSSSARGCHYLHLDKGVCTTDQFLDSCRIFQPDEGGECWDPDKRRNDENWKGETFTVNSRCFLSNISLKQHSEQDIQSRQKRSNREEGRCYEQRCNDTNTLEIRVRGSSWVLCKSNEKVQIPGYSGFIRCPATALMCNANISSRARTRFGSAICANAVLVFSNLSRSMDSSSWDKSVVEMNYHKFAQALNKIVNELIRENDTSVVPGSRITGDMVQLQFKSLLSNSRSCTQAVLRLKKAVSKGKLVVPFENKKFPSTHIQYFYTLLPCTDSSGRGAGKKPSSFANEKPVNTTSYGAISPGVIAAAAVGGVCITVFAAVWLILYAKSVAPNAVGPVTGLGPEVSYQPNSRASPPSLSENGSVGQIQFPI